MGLWYRSSQAFIRGAARLFYGYQVEGVENVPREGGVLLAANHKSYLDPPLIGAALPREIHYFAKKELFSVPVLAPMIRNYGAIPVDRDGFDRRAVELALKILEGGEGLLVFPEGTRIRRRGLAGPKLGIGMLAVRSGAPVVPVFVRSSWEPDRSLLRRIPVQIRYGPPIRFPSAPPGPGARKLYADTAASVMEAIRALE